MLKIGVKYQEISSFSATSYIPIETASNNDIISNSIENNDNTENNDDDNNDSNDNDKFKCQNCNNNFQSNFHLERHKNSKRQCKKKPDDHKCNNCKKNFSNKYNLATHMKKCCSNIINNDIDVNQNTSSNINSIKDTIIDELFNNISQNNEMITRLLKKICLNQNTINELN